MALIRKITVSNYKSIAFAELSTQRVNVFIGGPNSGKSNLIEALGLLSSGIERYMPEIARAREAADLFVDHDITADIDVRINDNAGWNLKFDSNRGVFPCQIVTPAQMTRQTRDISPNFSPGQSVWLQNTQSPIRYYQFPFQKRATVSAKYGHLEPPYGENLAAVLYSD